MLRPLVPLCACALLLLGLVACGGTRVTRGDTNQTLDLSGNWNAEDSRLVAQAMVMGETNAAQPYGGLNRVYGILEHPWHTDFKAQHRGEKPVLKVGRVIVRSNGDVIDTQIFTDDIRRALINSGQVRVVASNSENWQTRNEQADQDVHASEATRKEAFQEIGSDYLLQGTIKVQDDKAGRTTEKFYSIDLVLTHVKSQEIVWQGNKKIRKIVERSATR